MERTINLNVPMGFVVPDEERLLSDAAYAAEVLTTGVTVTGLKYDAEMKHVMEERTALVLKQYEQQRDVLQDTIRGLTESVARKEVEVRRVQNELQEGMSGHFENGRQAGRREGSELLEREREELRECKRQLEETKKDLELLRHSILEKMNELHNTLTGKRGLSSKEIGQIGEDFAKAWIESDLNPVQVTVVSDTPHSADLLVEREGVKVLLEIKNKQSLDRIEDLKKFHDDIGKPTFVYGHVGLIRLLTGSRIGPDLQ